MTSAREEFLKNIGGVRKAANSPSLQQLARITANAVDNKMAELLRRGLYIVAFNAMEDYLKNRVGEHFANLPTVSALDFDQLPPNLRRAAVLDAIKNGVREAGYDRDKLSQMQILRTVAAAVASTDSRRQYSIHEFSVLRSAANISVGDIASALGTLHLEAGWDQMQGLLDQVGNVGAPIRARFDTCSLKRNAAAHGGQDIDFSDLIEIADLAIPLCFAFDVIFSAGMSRIADNVPTADNEGKVQLLSQVVVRLVAQRNNRWCRLNRNKQPLKYFQTRGDAVQNSLQNLAVKGVVAVLGDRGEIADWHLADQRHPHG